MTYKENLLGYLYLANRLLKQHGHAKSADQEGLSTLHALALTHFSEEDIRRLAPILAKPQPGEREKGWYVTPPPYNSRATFQAWNTLANEIALAVKDHIFISKKVLLEEDSFDNIIDQIQRAPRPIKPVIRNALKRLRKKVAAR